MIPRPWRARGRQAGSADPDIPSVWAFLRFFLACAGARAAGAVSFMTLAALTEGASIVLFIPVLHLVADAEGGSEGTGGPGQVVGAVFETLGLPLSLPVALAGCMLLLAARAGFLHVKHLFVTRLTLEFVEQQKVALFRAVSRSSWSFAQSRRTSEIQNLLSVEVDKLEQGIFCLLHLLQTLTLIVIYLCISVMVSPYAALLALALGATIFLLLYPHRRRCGIIGHHLTEKRRSLFNTTSEFLYGMKSIKSFMAEDRLVANYAAVLADIKRFTLGFAFATSLNHNLFQLAAATTLMIIILVGKYAFGLSLIELAAVIFIFARIGSTFHLVNVDMTQIMLMLPAFGRLQATQEDFERAREDLGATEDRPTLRRVLRFDRVSFRYPGAPAAAVLDGVSFSVPALAITALVGPSGSGKTTIADLLMGFQRPDAGVILIDDVALSAANLKGWRRSLAYVPQETFLLYETVRGNLLLAEPEAGEDELWEALRLAAADRFVRALPAGLDTVVGNQGTRLSGGERQRIALARALLRRPGLLILDEATSALDGETQASVAAAIRRLRKSMTIVTIAHRLSMVAFADWVVIVDGGRVVEEGAYHDLIRNPASLLSSMVAAEGGVSRRAS